MDRTVIWAESALRDLQEIYDYIATRDDAAAVRVMHDFDRKADLYAGNPLLGEAHPEFGAELRAFRVGKYVVFYRPNAMGIGISRVVHSARDLSRLVEGDF